VLSKQVRLQQPVEIKHPIKKIISICFLNFNVLIVTMNFCDDEDDDDDEYVDIILCNELNARRRRRTYRVLSELV